MSDYPDEVYQEIEKVVAFAKLQGPMFKHFIYKKSVILGRDPGEETDDEQKIVLDQSQKISRQHLKIFWDSEKNEWQIQSLSKNKIYVNKAILRKEDAAMPLNDCASIKMDQFKFYFFPAY